MQRIRTSNDIDDLLAKLIDLDVRLKPIQQIAGPIPLRLSKPDFAGLADIVVSQHISKLSAAAIMSRLVQAVNPLSATQLIKTHDEVLIQVGLTRAKQQTLQSLAKAVVAGELDLSVIGELAADDAVARLTAYKGIGPWTAEVFLLFCSGHVDVFPAGDVALRTAIGQAFDLQPRPSVKEVTEIAKQWAPLRSVAARLFWAYYATQKSDQWRQRDAQERGKE